MKSEYINKIKNSVQNNYNEYIQFLKNEKPFEELGDGLSSYFVNFWSDNKPVILKLPYSNLSFYWFNLIDQYYNIASLIIEHKDCEDNDERLEIEDELFQFWESTELAKHFIDKAAKVGNFQASVDLLSIYEMQIVGFFHLHLGQVGNVEIPYSYQLISELGDSEKKIYVNEGFQYFCPKESLVRDNLIEIKAKEQEAIVLLDENENSSNCNIFQSEMIRSSELNFRSPANLTPEQLQIAQDKFLWATDILKIYFPAYWKHLNSFTTHIIPVCEEGVVSYSLQMLPGFSCLNLIQRDYIETLDDLLHENGHHFLNAHLNHQELINEDDEKIYWSPWRKQLRPVRGIYHAYCTFYWAAMFFNELSVTVKNNIALANTVETKDKNAISRAQFRAWEEFTMLNICDDYILHAYDDEKISEAGLKIYQLFKLDLVAKKDQFAQHEKSLSDKNHVFHSKYLENKKFLEMNKAKYWKKRN